MSFMQKRGHRRTLFVMLFAVLNIPFLLFAESSNQVQSHADIAAIKAEISRLITSEYPGNFKSDDLSKWPAMFADDAVLLLSGRPTRLGKAEIEAFNAEAHKKMIVNNLEVRVEGVQVSGAWAFCWGDFVEQATLIGSNESGNRGGRFFVLWERQDDGSWKIIADMGNSATTHGR